MSGPSGEDDRPVKSVKFKIYGYGSIPINTIFSGMDIHLPAILGFTRYQGFDPSPYIASIGFHWLPSSGLAQKVQRSSAGLGDRR